MATIYSSTVEQQENNCKEAEMYIYMQVCTQKAKEQIRQFIDNFVKIYKITSQHMLI